MPRVQGHDEGNDEREDAMADWDAMRAREVSHQAQDLEGL